MRFIFNSQIYILSVKPFFFLFLITVFVCTSGCAREGIYHSVKKGETLYRIGKVYDVDPRYIARANGIFIPRNLKAGQQLFIPGAKSTRTVTPYRNKQKQTKRPVGKKTSSPSTNKVAGAAATSSAIKKKTQKTNSSPTAINKKPTFSWPVKGSILRSFNPQGRVPCRGVEISASRGTPVRSAGAGRVIYSGDGIRGYGHLLILEHENSFFTVYGYNQKNLVKTGTFVGNGEKIALTGSPPDGRSGRLHFEVRHGNEAVNPRLFLP